MQFQRATVLNTLDAAAIGYTLQESQTSVLPACLATQPQHKNRGDCGLDPLYACRCKCAERGCRASHLRKNSGDELWWSKLNRDPTFDVVEFVARHRKVGLFAVEDKVEEEVRRVL